MRPGRGALLVFEGCDRAGKSTQVKMLVEALNKMNIPAEARSFPNRTTPIGKLLNTFLSKKSEFPLETVHLMFSANRWECRDEMLKMLHSGTTLVVDRYAGSGAAYTSATSGRSLDWCKEADKGLPSPDLVLLLKVSATAQSLRSNWGDERFENSKLQESVANNFDQLMDDSWSIVNADREKSVIHSEILNKALAVIRNIQNEPIGELYTTAT